MDQVSTYFEHRSWRKVARRGVADFNHPG